MDPVLRELVERGGGLVTRTAVREVVPVSALERACACEVLVRVLPEVFAAARLLAGPGLPPEGPDSSRPWAGASGRSRPASAVPRTWRPRSAVPGESRPCPAVPSMERPCPAVPGTGRPLRLVSPIARLPPDRARQAACAWADGRAALSHLSALDVWGLHRQQIGDPLHLSAPAGIGIRSRPGVVVHRRRGFRLVPPQVVTRRGLPVTALEQSLVDSWPLLPAAERRTPIIRAVNDRLTHPDRLTGALRQAPKLDDRVALRALLDRLAAGCRSPLEIWGHDHVFTGPEMPRFQRQARLRVGGRIFYPDMYAERERVDIELDGATVHGDPRQREIDLRRDAALATIGVLVVRFAHRRLVHEPDDVRRETLAILANRRNPPAVK